MVHVSVCRWPTSRTHTMTQQPWMDEFDEKFVKTDQVPLLKFGENIPEAIKSFITTQITAAEERGRNMAVEYITRNAPYCDFDNDMKKLDVKLTTLEEARSNRPTV